MVTLAEAKARANREGWADWIRSEADERALLEGCHFKHKRGQHVADFFNGYLYHTVGEWAGKRFKLLDWQYNDIIMPLFGWRRQTGERRYRKADIFIAKKNGKTTLCAGLVPYFLLADGEARAQVFGAAFTREQAGLIYQEAEAMITTSPELAPMFKCLSTRKRVLCPSTNSFYQALAGEAGPVEGVDASAVIFDEIHVQKTDVLWKALAYAKTARRQPMTVSISTVGVADRTQIWWSRYEYAKRLISGEITDSATFAYVAQADEACASDVTLAGDETQWYQANPSLGITVKLDQFREDYAEARNSPVMFNAFLRYKLNVPTAQESRMIPMDDWDQCTGDRPELAGRECFAGLDLSDSDDITSCVYIFPPLADSDRYQVLGRYWCPRDVVEKRIAAGFGFYQTWLNDGRLTLTEGNYIDYQQVEADIKADSDKYNIRQLGYDPWNAAGIGVNLNAYGIEATPITQTMSGLAFGTKRLMELVGSHKYNFDGDEVLRWMAGNAAGVMDHAGNLRPAKDKSTEKIDGIVALAMATGLACASEEAIKPQVLMI